MVGKHDEKNSGINSLAKCGGCKATGRIIIGSKSDINYRHKRQVWDLFFFFFFFLPISMSNIVSVLDGDSSSLFYANAYLYSFINA